MRRYLARGGVVILKYWIPYPVVAVIVVTLLFAILADQWRALFNAGVLYPRAVLTGEVWRVATWVFLETNLGSLVLSCFLIAWFGPAVCHAWGARRFLALYFACAVVTGTAMSLLALALPASWLRDGVFITAWPMVAALLVAWASLFAERQVLLFFMLPLKGSTLIWTIVAGTLLLALAQGLTAHLPELVAEGIALLYLRPLRSVRSTWLRLRLWGYERRLRRRAAHLTLVRRDERRPPTYH